MALVPTDDRSILLVLNILHIVFSFLPVRLLRDLAACSLRAHDTSELHAPYAVYKHVIRDQVCGAVEYVSLTYCTERSPWVLSSITAILISRFILDLHDTHHAMAQHGGLAGIQIMGSDIGRPCSGDFVSLETAKSSVISNMQCEAALRC